MKITFKNQVKLHRVIFFALQNWPNPTQPNLTSSCILTMNVPIPSKFMSDRNGPHFSNLRSDKITMLVKYDKTCIDISTFVNRVKVRRNLLMCTTSCISVHRCCQQWCLLFVIKYGRNYKECIKFCNVINNILILRPTCISIVLFVLCRRLFSYFHAADFSVLGWNSTFSNNKECYIEFHDTSSIF